MNKSAIARTLVLQFDGPNATETTLRPFQIIQKIMDETAVKWQTAVTYFYNSRKQIAAGNLNPKRGRPAGWRLSDEAKAARLAAKAEAEAAALAAEKAAEAKKEAQREAKRARDRARRAKQKAAKNTQPTAQIEASATV